MSHIDLIWTTIRILFTLTFLLFSVHSKSFYLNQKLTTSLYKLIYVAHSQTDHLLDYFSQKGLFGERERKLCYHSQCSGEGNCDYLLVFQHR